MKWWLAIVAISLIGVWTAGAYLPHDLRMAVGKAELIEDGTYSDSSAEDDANDLCEYEERALAEEGVLYSCNFKNDGTVDLEKTMAELGVKSREEVMSLLGTTPLVSLHLPFASRELALVYYLIVALSKGTVPVDGDLEKISFIARGNELVLFAELFLSFSRFKTESGFYFLPENAEASVSISFCLKNSEISVLCDKIEVYFDGCLLPDVLLSSGCDVALGREGGERFFACAVGNVVRNACFSG